MLEEKFGYPVFNKIGVYAGDAPAGAPGISGPVEETEVCQMCGMMPVDGDCGCGGSDEVEVCPGCGMMPVDGSCGCMHESAAPCEECGMMPLEGEGCGCTHTDEAELEEATRRVK